ncbi:MAG TPA: GNAT family N-acetyltransferase [Flavobacteriales bacterium]|jgi:GNAT superfamily N-acetyltransferase|nr:GNAT family N-acetyltransferase [Flavobacteriales bacterium]
MGNHTEVFTVRKGTKNDVKAVHALIVELAIYERAEQEVSNTVDQLLRDGFGEDPVYELLVAETEEKVVGMALWYTKYSTWKGKCGYLEDLVVQADVRGRGIGKALFLEVAKACAHRGYGRMEWQVLDWNEPAIGFYRSLGAGLDPEWLNGKLTKDELQTFL